MAWKFGRPTRLSVKTDIRQIIRTFPSTYVRIKRREEKYDPETGEHKNEYTLVYKGEALVRPTGGVSQTYGLGTTEENALVILIAGKQDIRQSDIVTINDGREYAVQFPPNWFNAFMVLTLDQWSQIGQPT